MSTRVTRVTRSMARKQKEQKESEELEQENDENYNDCNKPKAKQLDLASFECPICLELPSGVIFNCEQGHTICGDCYELLTDNKCPSCRVSLQHKFRNRLAEKVLSVQYVNCTNDGCNHIVLFPELTNHIKQCNYSEIQCKYSLLGCHWNGYKKNQNHHQKRCPMNTIHIDEILKKMQELNRKKLIYQNIANKYERIINLNFIASDNNQTDNVELEKLYESTSFEVIDSEYDEIMGVCYMLITKKIVNDDEIFYVNFKLDFDNGCNANLFQGISLEFIIIDYNQRIGIDAIEFEPLSDSRMKISTSPIPLNIDDIDTEIVNASRMQLRLGLLHSNHQYQ